MADSAIFIVTQGADWNQQLVLQNDDGSPMNLTGCQVHMQVRAYPGSPVVLLDLSTAAGTMTLNGAAAQINWDVSATQTASLQPSPGISPLAQLNPGTAFLGNFDLLIKYPNGQILPYLDGQILLKLSETIPF